MELRYLDPQPAPGAVPARMPSPFDAAAVPPLARREAEALAAEMGETRGAGAEGKMFGVLIVRARDGRIGVLRAFSGMLGGAWDVPGFVPPAFDPAAKAAIWTDGEAELAAIDARLAVLEQDPSRAALAELDVRLADEMAFLTAQHRAAKAARARVRAQLAVAPAVEPSTVTPAPAVEPSTVPPAAAVEPSTVTPAPAVEPSTVTPAPAVEPSTVTPAPAVEASTVTPAPAVEPSTVTPAQAGVQAHALHLLAQQSRADTAEHRRLVARHATARADLAAAVAALDAARDALVARKAARSRTLLHGIYDSYRLANARGERAPLRALFAPAEPPGGAGDCAAPKLLAHAYRIGATPLALAELWLGPPPATGGRAPGVYYPACRGKCGPVLAHMLAGLPVEAAPEYGAAPIAAAEPRVVYADDHVLVVDKPVGLLSVPGRSGRLRDSVQTRLHERYPHATGPLVVHRLDLDTSGLLLVALDSATHAALQADFARRAIAKRYLAILDGDVAAPAGTIELPLRVDLDDRPRQIVDPVHGKSALTEYVVLGATAGRTRVALAPRTGRTHQLRVHCAHPQGLGAAIAGDRLYGRPTAPRLLLHAESLAFVQPATGERIEVTSQAPF